MFGVFTMKYGKGVLVYQCKTQEEAEKKCLTLEPLNDETGKYFIRKF